MHRKAINHLTKADESLAELIRKIGPCRLTMTTEGTHFAHVMRSIVYQQLSGKAAATIFGRVLDLYPGRSLSPALVMKTPHATLRAAGLSDRKAQYVVELAARTHSGELAVERLHELDDDAVIDTLVQVRGIGRWTAQMVLMFRLGRPDVLPELDLGVQKAVQKMRRMRKLPTPEKLQKIGEAWSPYRTVASWYLWRSLELPD